VTLPTELLPHGSPSVFSKELFTFNDLPFSIPHQWAGEDSNLRRHEPSDLQSDAFDRFATCPTIILTVTSTTQLLES